MQGEDVFSMQWSWNYFTGCLPIFSLQKSLYYEKRTSFGCDGIKTHVFIGLVQNIILHNFELEYFQYMDI